jgi:hypothetical protein
MKIVPIPGQRTSSDLNGHNVANERDVFALLQRSTGL